MFLVGIAALFYVKRWCCFAKGGLMVRQEITSFRMDCGAHTGLECTAPCSLYSVLLGHGIIGDPSLSDNALEIKKYADRTCAFTAEVEITPLIMSMKSVLLRFSGLDTLCRIELNGHEIGATDNMHRTYDFDVKTRLLLGKNVLKLTFTPPRAGVSLRRSYGIFNTDSAFSLSDMGIFRKVEIIAFNHKIISDVKVKQTHSEKSVRLDLSVNTVGYDLQARAVATLTSPAGHVYYCGFVAGEGTITISDPNLWWPNGMGMQNLYKLNVSLYSDSNLEDTYEMMIGLRTFNLHRDKDSVTLYVNDAPMLAMGGEYLPEDVLASRSTEARTRALLESARDANFNSIFIHGSGYYPESYFFDACDELGLVVWAELPVPEADIEDTEDFKQSVKREMRDNLTRMAHHPSLAVILGNKRVASLFASESEAVEFAKSFSAFEGMNVFDLLGECSDSFERISHDSLPTYDTVVKFAEPDKRNLGSLAFELHGFDAQPVMRMLSDAYGQLPYANGMKELSYVSGLSSAELSMKDADEIRRRAARPIGILMSSMNEPWPSLSASAVDYFGGKKPLHYYEHHFFSPTRISVVQSGTRVRFTVSNTMRQDYVGIFAYAIMNNKNQAVFRDSFPIKVRASSNLDVHNADLGSVIKGHEQEYYLLYSVSDKYSEASVGAHLFTSLKRYAFNKPTFTTQINGNGTDYVVEVSADCFAKGVEVTFDGVDVTLDKNYFDITGRAPVRIRLRSSRMTTIEKLKRVMKIRSVYDLGREE